jgi:hypothetical protein
MPDTEPLRAGDAEALTGRLTEYRELLDVLAERPGLTVVSADPWSGTSAVLAAAIEALDGMSVSVDARICGDGLDLAVAIADTTVRQVAPEASDWWLGTAPPASTAGLRLSRTLSTHGIDLDELRVGAPPGQRRLPDALELLMALSDGEGILVVDHLGPMLSGLPEREARWLLGELRTARQAHPGLDLVLVEYADGPLSSALADSGHPLYRAGQVVRFRRPRPARFSDDLAITRPWTDAPVELIGAAAELAAGVPALVWRIVELAPSDGEDAPTRALAGWRRLRRMTAAQTARQWDLLRRVHPVAQPVVAAIGVGLRPHAVAANPKSINDVLGRLRELGMAWQPQPRRWALSDPLLAAWVRDRPPPWTTRRG